MHSLRHLVLLFFLLGSCTAFGQQLPAFALFRDNWNVLNPASVSSDYLFGNHPMSVFGTYRNQWNNVEGAPETTVLNAEYVLDYWNIITGLGLIHDQAGAISNTGLFGRFGYRLNLDRRGDYFINVALSGGMVQYRADLADLDLGANLLELTNDLVYYPDFGIGFMYYHDDLFYLGVSVPQTFGLSTTVRTDNGSFEIVRNQHFYLMGGTYFDIYAFNSDASYLELSGFIRYVPNAPLAIDVHARVQLGEILYLGFGGGISQMAQAEAGIIIGESMNFNAGQVRLGAAYSVGISQYAQAFGNSLELHAIYSFDVGR